MGRLRPDEVEQKRVVETVATLGWNIRTARRRINLAQSDIAIIARISRTTVRSIEEGALGTSIGAYAAVLCVLGIDKELRNVAQPTDMYGRKLPSFLPPDCALARRQEGRIQEDDPDW